MIVRIDGWFQYTDKKTGVVKYGYNVSTEPKFTDRSEGRNHLTVFLERKPNVQLDHEYEVLMEPVVIGGNVQNRIIGFVED